MRYIYCMSIPRPPTVAKTLSFFVLMGGEIWWTTSAMQDHERPVHSYLGNVNMIFHAKNLITYDVAAFLEVYRASLPHTTLKDWEDFFEVYPMFVKDIKFELS